MIFVARCASCGCAVIYLEITEKLSVAEKQRRTRLVDQWRNDGARIEEREDPLLPDDLGIHATECLGQVGYRRDSGSH